MSKKKPEWIRQFDMSRSRLMTISPHKANCGHVDLSVESENGDTDVIGRVSKKDAIALIKELRTIFDLPDEAEQLRDLINLREERTMAYLNQLAAITIANVMTQNDLHRVVLPINSASLVPRPMHIDFDIENGLLTYTLERNENE